MSIDCGVAWRIGTRTGLPMDLGSGSEKSRRYPDQPDRDG